MQKVMNANIEKMVKAIEKLDWIISFSEDCPDEAYISQSSPLGDDFGFDVYFSDEYEFKDGIAANCEDFDPEEHAAMWWSNRNTTGGVPNSLALLLEDANDIKNMLSDLLDAVNEVVFE